uniref:Uncharacterized protein n=1 Tax=Acrobeloides nanus TaxID=290746 RepID=A0A914BUK8_9BILA
MNQNRLKIEPSSFDGGFEDLPEDEIPGEIGDIIQTSQATELDQNFEPSSQKLHIKRDVPAARLVERSISEDKSFVKALWSGYKIPPRHVVRLEQNSHKSEESEMEEAGSSHNANTEISATSLVKIQSEENHEFKNDAHAHAENRIRHSVWKFFEAFNQMNEEGLFQKAACSFCGAVLSNVKAINAMDHLNKNHPGEYIKVSDMEKDRLKAWVKRQKSKGSKEKNLQVEISEKLACDKCAFNTTDPAELTKHKLVHTGQTYSCNVDGCKFVATLKSAYLKHIRQHSEPVYKCSTCKSGYNTQKELSEHEASHFLKCTEKYCIFKTKSSELMEQHMMEFHKKVVKKKDCSNEKKPIIVYKNFTSPEERKACATRAMNKSTDPNIKKKAEIVDTRETNHPRDLDAPKKRRRDFDAPPKDMELRLENFSIPKKKAEGPPKKRVRFADEVSIINPPEEDIFNISEAVPEESISIFNPMSTDIPGTSQHSVQNEPINQSQQLFTSQLILKKKKKKSPFNMAHEENPKTVNDQWQLFIKRALKNVKLDPAIRNMLKTLVGVHNLPKTEEKFVKFMANSRNFKDEKASKKVFKEIVKGAERIKQDQLKAEKPKKIKDGQGRKKKALDEMANKASDHIQMTVDSKALDEMANKASDHIQMTVDSVLTAVLEDTPLDSLNTNEGLQDQILDEREQNIVGVTAVVMESQASSSNELLATLLQDVLKNKEMKQEPEVESEPASLSIKTEVPEQVTEEQDIHQNLVQNSNLIAPSSVSSTPTLSNLLQASPSSIEVKHVETLPSTSQQSLQYRHPLMLPGGAPNLHQMSGITGPMSPQQIQALAMGMKILPDGRSVPINPMAQYMEQRAMMQHQMMKMNSPRQMMPSYIPQPQGHMPIVANTQGSIPQSSITHQTNIQGSVHTDSIMYPLPQETMLQGNPMQQMMFYRHPYMMPAQQIGPNPIHSPTLTRPVSYPCSSQHGCTCPECHAKTQLVPIAPEQMTSPVWYPQGMRSEFIYPNPTMTHPMMAHSHPIAMQMMQNAMMSTDRGRMSPTTRVPYPPINSNMQIPNSIASPLNSPLMSPSIRVSYPQMNPLAQILTPVPNANQDASITAKILPPASPSLNVSNVQNPSALASNDDPNFINNIFQGQQDLQN